jgi:hypothetical protein
MGTWAWLSGSAWLPEFNDLRQLTFTAECAGADPTWTINSQTCDPNDRAYNYPSLWISILKGFGVTSAHTAIVGWILIGLMVITIALLTFHLRSRILSISQVAVLSLAAISPPVWLAMDRGNSDVVIFFLVVAAIGLGSTKFRDVSVALLMIATALKIYAFGAGLWFLSLGRRGMVFALVLAIFVLSYALYMREELSVISQRTPRPNHMAFGVTVLPSWFLEHFKDGQFATGRIIGLVSLVLFVLITTAMALVVFRFKRVHDSLGRLGRGLASDPRLSSLFLTGTGVISVAYLVGSSYDYRLIFLVPVLFSFALLEKSVGKPRWVLLAGTLAVLLLSGPWLVLGRISDFLWPFYMPLLLIIGCCMIYHANSLRIGAFNGGK